MEKQANTVSYKYLFKYIIIGDSGVGKSSVIQRFIENRFNDRHEITIGVEFGSRNLDLDGTIVKLQIWDTAGQEDFKSITRAYYRSSAGALVVYDITRRDTFEHVQKWIEEAKSNGNEHMTFILLGNKTDLENQREVQTIEGQELADKHGMSFVETSAKDATNVNDAFIITAMKIIDKIEKGEIDRSDTQLLQQIGIKINEEQTTIKLTAQSAQSENEKKEQ